MNSLYLDMFCDWSDDEGRKKVTDSTTKIEKAKALEEEELAKLVELKENLGDNLPPQYTDAHLLGFLRARSLNVKEAQKLMKIDGNMRQFLRADAILDEYEPSETNMQCSISGMIGFDKEGSLIRVINVGYGDYKGFIHSISTIEEFKIFIWSIQKDSMLQAEECKKKGYKCNQIVYILNLENISMSQVMYKPALDTGLLALKLLQDHYHDAAKAIYVVNAPIFFSSIFKLFKPVIGDSLQKRLKIFDGDDWREQLLKHIDADILPAYLGGNRVDSNNDPLCREFIGFGGTIPESSYAANFLDLEDPDVVVATVPAGATLNFRFSTPIVGTVIQWHIQAKDNDIGIGVFYEPLDEDSDSSKSSQKKAKEIDVSELEPLTPIIRSQCHICPEIGSTVTWLSGTTVLHFDNTYSWMNSKEVQFKIIIEPPAVKDNNIPNSVNNAANAVRKMIVKQ
ncbi:retinal-binding protein-like [Stegodyphus dumicola]|uniref:retinal-binding protein-like n=1 Tax=Stegodyphus dumicola TaxID=202533 RepID=UPI0015B2E408|nr:retinal-binding protein-like [Stegodyphus dumicola]